LALLVGLGVFLVAYWTVFPSGCAAMEGVPSWERCASLVGLPAFSLTDWGLDNTFDILIPVLPGAVAGAITRRWVARS
jgi:hypothetical protein